LKAIQVAEKKSKEAAARELKVNPKRIREWCNEKGGINFFSQTKKSTRKHLKWWRKEAK